MLRLAMDKTQIMALYALYSDNPFIQYFVTTCVTSGVFRPVFGMVEEDTIILISLPAAVGGLTQTMPGTDTNNRFRGVLTPVEVPADRLFASSSGPLSCHTHGIRVGL